MDVRNDGGNLKNFTVFIAGISGTKNSKIIEGNKVNKYFKRGCLIKISPLW